MSERKCTMCQTEALRFLVRSDLGAPDDRMLVCGKCMPPEGQWQSYALDGAGLAKEYKEKKQ